MELIENVGSMDATFCLVNDGGKDNIGIVLVTGDIYIVDVTNTRLMRNKGISSDIYWW